MLNLGPIGFLLPWLLLALAALPVIWWLLRVTPPAPSEVRFPPVRILRSLFSEDETPSTTPLWLVLLRLLLAALVILALAHPVLNPKGSAGETGPMLLVIDDSWAAAPAWPERETLLADLLTQAERDKRPVALLTTTPSRDGEPMQVSRLMPAAEARTQVAVIRPNAWRTDRSGAVAAMEAVQFAERPTVHWLADNVEDGAADRLGVALAAAGPLTIYRDQGPAFAVLQPTAAPDGLDVLLLRDGGPAERRWLRATAPDGRILARAAVDLAEGETGAEAHLTMPLELRNETAALSLENYASAAGTVLLDDLWRRRPVGLASGAGAETEAQPLLAPSYYIERALAPFADLRTGTAEELLEKPLAVLILSDIGRLTDTQQTMLAQWVDQGGVLVRFAGPHMAQGVDALVPVELRSGGRSLDGALSWSEPAQLADFPETSPFRGLQVPADVRVRRQVLAQPSLDLPTRTWARLADGTPLVTGTRRGQGWLILFHTTANADWSNLPLSGLFVDMLQRITQLSRGVAADGDQKPLPPFSLQDGFGRLGAPGALARPLTAAALDQAVAAPLSPPGYYGSESARRALNLTRGWQALTAIGKLPVPARELAYVGAAEFDLKPWLLGAALLLTLLDLVIALALRGLLPRRRSPAAVGVLLLAAALAWPGGPADAQSDERFALEATLDTRLAYVLTGDQQVDGLSQAGLAGLSDVLAQRTSIEPAAPMAVNVETDELVFFPLLYWPVTAEQRQPSDQAIARLSNYMRSGGTILFDTRDAGSTIPGLRNAGGSPAAIRLREILQRLDVPPLAPVPQEHVLTKAFYLMQSFPGRYTGGQVWVEMRPGGVNDGVSALVIGGNDWAAAWAVDETGRPMAAVIPGGEGQREMAYRFGVNLVMYTLTGNYKADQVHVPAILERLGQ